MERLPVLLSIPHGGDYVPIEVSDLLCISRSDILYDSDSLTREIFSFRGQVEAFLEASVARAVIDLNRDPYDRPPQNPDGVVKTVTVTGAPVYYDNQLPDYRMIDFLLNRYYYPYHQELEKLIARQNIKIALDCHSMLPYAPVYSRFAGKARPSICLSNGGNGRGEPADKGAAVTCPAYVIQQMAECFTEAFELPEKEVLINDPFCGGYIIRSHANGHIPWVQVEINRKLYLKMDSRKRPSISSSPGRVAKVRQKVWTALKLFFLNFNGSRPNFY